jgi:hypothetical protein
MKMDPEKCMNCYYWQQGDLITKDLQDGVCRRYPPTVIYENNEEIKNGGERPVVYPRTYENDWCGEFKDKRL